MQGWTDIVRRMDEHRILQKTMPKLLENSDHMAQQGCMDSIAWQRHVSGQESEVKMPANPITN